MSIFKITVAALLALLLTTRNPQAAEPAVVITLSCDGTVTKSLAGGEKHPKHAKPEPIKMGVVVNIAEQTVSGFDIVAHIENIDAAHISFGGESKPSAESISVRGEIDRVTGAVMATRITNVTSDYYELACKAASRVF